MLSMRGKMWSILSLGILVLLAGCGGSSSEAPPPPGTTSISGSVYASSVSGASVVVKNAAGATIAGPVTTSVNGTYTINVPTSAMGTDLRIESSGGTFTDEATGTPGVAAGAMSAYVSGGSATIVHLDPASTVIHALVSSHSKTFGEGRTLFTNSFGFAPDCTVKPVNEPYSASSTTAQRVAALRAAAFSQFTQDLGLAPDKQFELLAAIAQDLADGDLDGMNGTTVVSLGTGTMPADIQNRFENALVSFVTNTAMNLTGLTPGNLGDLSFGRIALTDTYKVEYVPGVMAASMGKTMFQIKISDKNTGNPVTNLVASSALTLTTKMHMATGANHGTPVDVITESAAGTYNCTIYYLMASGPNMGFWELDVTIGSGTTETATFYPKVGPAVDSQTGVQRLYGPSDIFSTMTGTQYTRYVVFRDESVNASTGTLNLLIAHAENMMMYFNPVSVGTVLSYPTGTALVSSMVVSAATDTAFTSPASVVTDYGNGHWSLSGLSGLVSGQTTTIYVKLSVNGENKTTNGLAPTGTNAYQPYVVTPQ
jgi:hypothetical protein